jgi:ribosome maturation factor RimP
MAIDQKIEEQSEEEFESMVDAPAPSGDAPYARNKLVDPDGRFAPILEPHIDGLGFRLVRVELTTPKGYKGPLLQIYAEPKEKRRMKLDDCKYLSKRLSAIMDVEDPIAGQYMMEVSSPGLDRALTRLEDFERFKGLDAKIMIEPAAENGQKRFSGRLSGLDEEHETAIVMELSEPMIIEEERHDTLVIDFDRIVKARLINNDHFLEKTKDDIL